LLTRGKIIYDVHEDYPKAILTKHWLPQVFRKPIAHLFDVLEKLIASHFACVISATDEIAGRFLNTSKVAIIKNYPIIEMIEPTSKKDPEKATLIYAGGLSKERGITEIVQAIANLNSSRDVKLILCGWFEPETYQISVKSLRGFSRVEYLGYIEPEHVWQKMAESTIGIVCLHPEERYTVALPVKLFEYMAAGLPVIASNFPLWKQIVEGNNCGITVNPLDHKEIAKAIDFLLMYPEKAQTMGENGREAVLEKFNWKSEGKKLMDIYGTILSGGKNNFS
jgi:glycosyltransferase involved in cell wall biosynthesis